jgi:hypothetical protein
MLPESETGSGTTYMSCCGKTICCGCLFAHNLQCNFQAICPFCRCPTPNEKESLEQLNNRVKVNDANAYYELGTAFIDGDHNFNLEMSHDQAREKGLQ